MEWLAEAGRRGWIALTHNKEIRYNTQERDMVMRAGVPLFMLIGHHPHSVLATNLVHSLPRVVRFFQRTPRPFIARVYKASGDDFAAGKPGRVNLWLSYDDWKRLITPSRP